MTYQGLYRLVSKALYRAHVEGKLKREIIQVGRPGRDWWWCFISALRTVI
jgi:hypothetical protein